ncbi:DNA pilot protein [Blackfly microvirus SF02]|uniref:DNA pilot protein n=1 Tax=Blackfly microvirus SF02 TaxID=2576452 RepID=A0A4P8PKB3_9VIRU|nr:DNA pilot protein [Blackfly microvirus SF02]
MAAWGAIAQAASSVVGGALSMWDNAQARKDQVEQNRRDREFQEQMWNKTNIYNSPVEQMARLKAAGLNPNLVYGNGATTTASNITPTASKALPERNTGAVVGDTLNQLVDLGLKQKQKDLLEVEAINTIAKTADTQSQTEFRNTVGTEEAIARKYGNISNARRTETLNSRDQFELDKAKDLRQNTIDASQAKLDEIQLRNAQEKIKLSNLSEMQKVQLLESYQRLQNAKATMNGQQLQNELMKEQLMLRKKGIEINNSPLWKMFQDLIPDIKAHNGRAWENAKSIGKKIWETGY